MLSDNQKVRETVVTVTGRDGSQYALIVYTDGAYGIARDGRPVDDARYSEGAMQQCVEHLVRLSGLDGPPEA